MKIVHVGRLRVSKTYGADFIIPPNGLIIEATEKEIAALPFNPYLAEVELTKATPNTTKKEENTK